MSVVANAESSAFLKAKDAYDNAANLSQCGLTNSVESLTKYSAETVMDVLCVKAAPVDHFTYRSFNYNILKDDIIGNIVIITKFNYWGVEYGTSSSFSTVGDDLVIATPDRQLSVRGWNKNGGYDKLIFKLEDKKLKETAYCWTY